MRRLKACLLLFIMLLLPARGAMAATGMLCHTGSEPAHSVAQIAVHHHAEHGTHDHGVDIGRTVHHGDFNDSADHTCNLCSAVCSTPPLAIAGAYIILPPAEGRLAFPPLEVEGISFVTDALERPPRTI